MTLKKFERVGALSPRQSSHGRHTTDLPVSAQLVGYGFRDWVTGYATGDLSAWERAWSRLSSAMGTTEARAIMSELDPWVRTVVSTSERPIVVAAPDALQLADDEHIAVALVTACQMQVCPVMDACAAALACPLELTPAIIDQATSLALVMRACGQSLPAEMLATARPALQRCAQCPLRRLH
jgi:hypothetical protein